MSIPTPPDTPDPNIDQPILPPTDPEPVPEKDPVPPGTLPPASTSVSTHRADRRSGQPAAHFPQHVLRARRHGGHGAIGPPDA